jgi:hypothetical protein
MALPVIMPVQVLLLLLMVVMVMAMLLCAVLDA